MRIECQDKYKNRNIAYLLRQAGYKQEVNRKTGQVSYVRRIGYGDFPRFHIYIEELPEAWEINLHLDQKAPSYRGTSAHGGEYSGEVVEAEIEHLKKFLL